MKNQVEQLKSAILPQFKDVIEPNNEKGENSFYYKRYCYEWEKEWKKDIEKHPDYNQIDKDVLIEFLKKQTIIILNTTKLFKMVDRYKEPNPSLSVKISVAQGEVEYLLKGIGYFENQLKHRVRQKEHSLALDMQYDLLLIFQESINILKSNCQIDVFKSPIGAKFEEARKKLKKAVIKKEIDLFLRVPEREKAINANPVTLPAYKDHEEEMWFKVGLKFATGEIKENALNKQSAPEIEKELGLPEGASKHILGTINDYQNPHSKAKNIYAYRMRMQLIIDHCEDNDIPIDPDFLSRMPPE